LLTIERNIKSGGKMFSKEMGISKSTIEGIYGLLPLGGKANLTVYNNLEDTIQSPDTAYALMTDPAGGVYSKVKYIPKDGDYGLEIIINYMTNKNLDSGLVVVENNPGSDPECKKITKNCTNVFIRFLENGLVAKEFNMWPEDPKSIPPSPTPGCP